MRVLLIAGSVALLATSALAGPKPPACIVLETKPVDGKPQTLADGTVAVLSAPSSADLADVQRSFLKKYSLATECGWEDLQIVLKGKSTETPPLPAPGSAEAGTRPKTRSFYLFDIRYPRGDRAITHDLKCPISSDDEDRAEDCVDKVREWVKVQSKLR